MSPKQSLWLLARGLNDYTMNIHIDGIPTIQGNQSKSLGLIIDVCNRESGQVWEYQVQVKERY